MVENKIKILVCCHKKDIMATDYPYYPIQVGKDLSSINLNIGSDNEGENISNKNNSYCELTGLYWAWKNLKDTDIIGLCHYRRYFDFHNQCNSIFPYKSIKTSDFSKIDLSIPSSIIKQVEEGKWVVANYKHYPSNLYLDYCHYHNSDDLRVLEKIFFETQPKKYMDAFNKVMYKNNKLIHYNMFLANWKDFDQYCSWLFSILSEAEKRIDITHYNNVQKRIYGYFAERLLNIYLYANNIQIIQKPILWIHDDEEDFMSNSVPAYLTRRTLNDLGVKIANFHKKFIYNK